MVRRLPTAQRHLFQVWNQSSDLRPSPTAPPWTRSWGYKLSIYSAGPEISLFWNPNEVTWSCSASELCALHIKCKLSHDDFSLSGKFSSCHNRVATAWSLCICTLISATEQPPQLSSVLSSFRSSGSLLLAQWALSYRSAKSSSKGT